MFEILLVGLLLALLLLSILTTKLALAACEDVARTKKAVEETQLLLSRTMKVNAWFHACTQARLRGEPEPPRPEFE